MEYFVVWRYFTLVFGFALIGYSALFYLVIWRKSIR